MRTSLFILYMLMHLLMASPTSPSTDIGGDLILNFAPGAYMRRAIDLAFITQPCADVFTTSEL